MNTLLLGLIITASYMFIGFLIYIIYACTVCILDDSDAESFINSGELFLMMLAWPISAPMMIFIVVDTYSLVRKSLVYLVNKLTFRKKK
jgi:hypothetical protein